MVAILTLVHRLLLLEDLVAIARTIHLQLCHLLGKLILMVWSPVTGLNSNTIVLFDVADFCDVTELGRHVRDASTELWMVDTHTLHRLRYLCFFLHLLRVRISLLIAIHKTSASQFNLQGLSGDAEVFPVKLASTSTHISVSASKVTLLD